MKTLAITDFKTYAFRILGQVAETREPVVVTKRGKPLTEVAPFSAPRRRRGSCPRPWCSRMTRLVPQRESLGRLPMKYLLDTHAWIWWNMRHLQARPKSLVAMGRAGSPPCGKQDK
jgi:prevent-host-death family protein